MDAENPVRKGPEQILTRSATEVKEQNKFDLLVLQGIDDVVLAARCKRSTVCITLHVVWRRTNISK